MADLLKLADDLRRVQAAYDLCESRDRRLGELVRTGAWKSRYDEETFKKMCAANEKDLAAGLSTLIKAENKLSNAALARTTDIQGARKLVARAQAQAHANYAMSFDKMRHPGENPDKDIEAADKSIQKSEALSRNEPAQPGSSHAGKERDQTPSQDQAQRQMEAAIAAWERTDNRDEYPLPGPDGRPMTLLELIRAEDAMLAEMERPL